MKGLDGHLSLFIFYSKWDMKTLRALSKKIYHLTCVLKHLNIQDI